MHYLFHDKKLDINHLMHLKYLLPSLRVRVVVSECTFKIQVRQTRPCNLQLALKILKTALTSFSPVASLEVLLGHVPGGAHEPPCTFCQENIYVHVQVEP